MFLLVCASFIAYLTTEIDDLIIMLILFSKASRKSERAVIIVGKYIGTLLVAGCSAIFASYISMINTAWLGLLGLVPIAIGIKSAADSIRRRKKDETEITERFSIGSDIVMCLEVILITLASSGDNVAVYISFFTAVHGYEYIVVAAVFTILQGLWCFLAIKIITERSIKQYIDQSSKILVPLLFITLGIYIMVKDGTILWLLGK